MTNHQHTQQQRDELARAIVDGYGIDADVECPCRQDYELADALLAAGYRKPHTIETVEELDALPEDSRLWGSSHRLPTVPGTGSPYVKVDGGDWWDFDNGYSVPAYDIMLPATVLYMPGAGE